MVGFTSSSDTARIAPAATTSQPGGLSLNPGEWIVLSSILAFTALVRVVSFNGPFGSDDVVYLKRAAEIADGFWSSANYNGALRYGFNIPAAGFIYLFGLSVFSANLWSLLCSIAEIGAVYIYALSGWGRRAAIYAALVLACIPLHIAVATRLHADPVVSLFLTLSFVLFYFAEQRRSCVIYFLTGMAIGMVFWAKELAIVACVALALYPLFWRKFDPRWLYVVAGGALMLVAHLILMTIIAGDPLHLFKVVLRQVSQGFIQTGEGEDAAWYYFRYLFFDVKHTWLAPFISVVALAAFARRCFRHQQVSPATAYATFWFLSLLAVLSFLPVSLVPFRLVMKQSNYLTLFLGPMALLAGYQLSRARLLVAVPLLTITVIGGVSLGLLEQQAYRVTAANSKAAVDFAKTMPDARFYGSVQNSSMALVYSVLDKDPSLAKRFGDLSEAPAGAAKNGEDPSAKVFAVIDKETMGWGTNAIPLNTAPACWTEVRTLEPKDLGLGHLLVVALRSIAGRLPEAVQARAIAQVGPLLSPRRATVYKVAAADFWCGLPGGR